MSLVPHLRSLQNTSVLSPQILCGCRGLWTTTAPCGTMFRRPLQLRAIRFLYGVCRLDLGRFAALCNFVSLRTSGLYECRTHARFCFCPDVNVSPVKKNKTTKGNWLKGWPANVQLAFFRFPIDNLPSRESLRVRLWLISIFIVPVFVRYCHDVSPHCSVCVVDYIFFFLVLLKHVQRRKCIGLHPEKCLVWPWQVANLGLRKGLLKLSPTLSCMTWFLDSRKLQSAAVCWTND